MSGVTRETNRRSSQSGAQDSTCVDVWSCSHLLPKTPSFSSMGTALCRLRYQLSNKYCQHKNARNKQKVMVCRSKAQRGHLNALWWGHAATRPGRLCFQSLKVGLWDVPVPAGCSGAGPRLGSHGGDGKGGVTHVRNISTQLLQEFLTFFFRAHGDHTQFTHPLQITWRPWRPHARRGTNVQSELSFHSHKKRSCFYTRNRK